LKFLIIGADTRSLIYFRRDLLLDIQKQGYEVHVIAPPADERGDCSILEKDGMHVHFVGFSRTGMNPIKDFSTLLELKSVIKSIRPDVVFSFMIKPVIYGSVAAYLAGVKSINSLIPGLGYTFMQPGLKGRILNFIVSRMYQFALFFNKVVFFQNRDDKALFMKSSIVPERKIRISNGSGVNTKVYKRSDSLSDKATFLLAGRIIKDKGIIEYLDALKSLKEKHGDKFEALLVGGFDKNPTSLKKGDIEPYEKAGVVKFLGDQDDMVKVFNQASVYVLPSYREGTPRSTLEAMCMKMPVVTTDAPGCRETVVEGENGHMVPIGSSKELAEKMERFIVEPGLISKMGEASYKLVNEKFEINKVNHNYMLQLGLLKEGK
jgi:glycosyltransferase involved in cell wall biosynthesis